MAEVMAITKMTTEPMCAKFNTFSYCIDYTLYNRKPNDIINYIKWTSGVCGIAKRRAVFNSQEGVSGHMVGSCGYYSCTHIFSNSIPRFRTLDTDEIQIAMKWLGMDTSSGSRCAMCPRNMLPPWPPPGHNAVTCKEVFW